MTKKTITCTCVPNPDGIIVHQFEWKTSPFCSRFGLEIINGSCYSAPVDGYFQTPWRQFDFYSLSFLREGRGLFQIQGENEQEVSPGDLIVITPGTVNRYGGAFQQNFVEETLRFSGEIADHLTEAGVLKSGKISGFSTGLFDEILELFSNPSSVQQTQANFKLLELLSLIYEKSKCVETDPLERLLEQIQQNPKTWWTVQDLAEKSGYSPNQFRHLFRKRTGMTPKHYIEEWKLRYASKLLLDQPELSIAEIAHQTGYVDEYHFAKRFKSLYSMPPGHYRRTFHPKSGAPDGSAGSRTEINRRVSVHGRCSIHK